LISFINAVVSQRDQVRDVVLVNPFNQKDHDRDRSSILDIKATDQNGRQYNVEMQITDQVYYNQRALYYWSKLYTSQLKSGDNFQDLRKTISINILNFNYFDDEPNYHNIYKLLNVESHKCQFEDMELHFIELQKFDKDLSHLKTTLDRWVNFLNKAHLYSRENFPPELEQEPAIGKAMHSLETFYLTDEEIEIYEAHLKWLRDEAAALQKAQIKGEGRGFKTGYTTGRVEGHAEGRAEGHHAALLNTAEKMLALGISLNTIAESTGLPLSEIEELSSDIVKT
jgi:predicted transposase/invertase (TIGR01784 family)